MSLTAKIKNEPVLVTAFIEAVIFLVTSFGLDLSQEQVASIMGITVAILAFYTRGEVTPMNKVIVHEDDSYDPDNSDLIE